MPTFTATDGTRLAYRVSGEGEPVICLPGGPMQDADYLEDLGGLSGHRRLLLLDPRGTGGSDVPADLSSYRCDRQVDDVEALRAQLGLDRLDLLGHSAGANLAVQYAARHPDRVARLALITPSVSAVGLSVTAQMRLEAAGRRAEESWFAPAYAALEDITAGTGQDWEAITPFFFARWDDRARELQAVEDEHTNAEAAAHFADDGAFDPPSTIAALAALDAPVLLLFGAFDPGSPVALADPYAALFRRPVVAVQPNAGHYPWLDDPLAFTTRVASFLD